MSLVLRYSLKFTCCWLLVLKSIVARCKIRLLLVAEIASCKKSLVIRCKIISLLVADNACCKYSLVACCKYSLVTRCRIRLFLFGEVVLCKKNTRHSLQNSLVTCCKQCVLQIHLSLVAKFARYSMQKITRYSSQNYPLTCCRSCSLQKFSSLQKFIRCSCKLRSLLVA